MSPIFKTLLPDTHDVAFRMFLQICFHDPGCVLPVGHDAAEEQAEKGETFWKEDRGNLRRHSELL